MRIIITGNPGTGKTKLAAWLTKKLNCKLLSITAFVLLNKLYEQKGKEKEVELKKLQKKLSPMIKKNKNLIIEGHLACEMKLPADYAIVLRCNPQILRKRLQKRKYVDKKLKENIMAELLDYATQKAQKNYRLVLELETSNRTVAKAGMLILKAIKLKKKKLEDISYDKELIQELKLK